MPPKFTVIEANRLAMVSVFTLDNQQWHANKATGHAILYPALTHAEQALPLVTGHPLTFQAYGL